MRKLLHLTYQEAKEHYPEHVKHALKSMHDMFRRARKDTPAPEEMEWSLQWVFDGLVVWPVSEISTTLYCCHGRRTTEIEFPDATLDQVNGEHLPYHVSAYYSASVDPAKIPNAGTFQIRRPNGNIDNAIATGGYICDGAIAVHYLIVGDPWLDAIHDEELIEIHGQRGIFEDGLKDLAQERYDAAGEGGEFSLGSRKMRRLTLDEIRPHVQGKIFTWTLFLREFVHSTSIRVIPNRPGFAWGCPIPSEHAAAHPHQRKPGYR